MKSDFSGSLENPFIEKTSFIILFFAVYSEFVLVSLEREKKSQYNIEKNIVFYKIPKRSLLWASSPMKKDAFVLQNILKPIKETENNLTLILPLIAFIFLHTVPQLYT